eukprot:TRINITY_DN15649_c3_g1_i1.p1 TRINITY_DN15649_c3_g1~~TRINITY_DN15649_c3_g1_i1.p1  ORF type:complete len:819 (+),score=159.05 TRINITY_DN15649_c3_g1_i1:53-2458(+)
MWRVADAVFHMLLCWSCFTCALGSVSEFDSLVNASTTHWTLLPKRNMLENTPSRRHKTWGTVLGDHFYFFSGVNYAGTYTNDFWRFSFITFEWEEVKVEGSVPPPVEKSRMVADEARNAVYLLPGKDQLGMWIYYAGNNTWEEIQLEGVPNSFDVPTFGADYAPANTLSHIVFAGTDGAISSDYCIFDKTTRKWQRGSYSGLAVEDPGATAVGSYAYVSGGTLSRGSVTPNITHRYDTLNATAEWEPLDFGLGGEEWRMFNPYGKVLLLLGDPGGKGVIAGNGIAMLDLEGGVKDKRFSIVNKTAGWVPTVSEFFAGTYRGTIILMGGVNSLQGSEFFQPEIYAFNPRHCPGMCSGNGDCVLANCICHDGHYGPDCSTSFAVSNSGKVVYIVVPVSFGVILIAAAVAWKATTRMRAYRRLYNNTRVAESMADSIARMELDELDYLDNIHHPTKVQSSFLSIVAILKTYKLFIPDPILQGAKGLNAASPMSGVSPIRRDPTLTFTSNSAHSSEGGNNNNADFNQPHQGPRVSVGQTLMTKTEVKKIAVCEFRIVSYERWTEKQSNLSHQVGIFSDAVHDVVQLTRGTILDAALSRGSITCAWNFQVRKGSPECSAAEAAISMGNIAGMTVVKIVTKSQAICGTLGGSNLRVPVLIGPSWETCEILYKIAYLRQVECITNVKSLSGLYPLIPVDIVAGTGLLSKSLAIPYEVTKATPIAAYALLVPNTANEAEWMYVLEEIQNNNAKYLAVMSVYEKDGAEAAVALMKGGAEEPHGNKDSYDGSRYLLASLGMENIAVKRFSL